MNPKIPRNLCRRFKFCIYPILFLNYLLCLSFSQANEGNQSELSPFEKAELRRLLSLDFRNLSQVPIQSVLGYEQEYWRNPASVHVIQPEDVTQFGYANTVEALRGVPGMHVSRGLAYDNLHR